MAPAEAAARLPEPDLTPGALFTTPREHYALLHSDPHGDVICWDNWNPGENGNGIWSKALFRHPLSRKLKVLDALEGQLDRYMTVNQFVDRWHLKTNVCSYRACYIDIDGSTDLDGYIDRLHQIGVPDPSVVFDSGRGLHLYWLLHPTPGQSGPLWDKIQNRIYEILNIDELEGEPDAHDCSRLLRVAGSVNAKSGRRAYGRIYTGERWTLRELADEVLGPRAAYETRKPKSKTKKSSGGDKSKYESANTSDFRKHQPNRTPIAGYSRWRGVYADLIRIAEHHGTIPRGHRETWLYVAATALSWFANAESLSDEIEQLIKRYIRDPDGPTSADIKHIVQRARDAAATDADGNPDPVLDAYGFDRRYRMSRAYITKQISAIVPDAIAHELRTIGSPELAEQQKRERWRRNKRAQRTGQHMPRDEYEQQARDWHARAQSLAADGWTQAAIAEAVGKSRSQVSRVTRGGGVHVCPPCTAPPAGGAALAARDKEVAERSGEARTAEGRRFSVVDEDGGRREKTARAPGGHPPCPSSAATNGSAQTERAAASATPSPLSAGEVPRHGLSCFSSRSAGVRSLNLSTVPINLCELGSAGEGANRRVRRSPLARALAEPAYSLTAAPVGPKASVVRQSTAGGRGAIGRGAPCDGGRPEYDTPAEPSPAVWGWSGGGWPISNEQRLSWLRLIGSKSLRSPSRSVIGPIGRRWLLQLTGVDFDHPVLLLNLGESHRQYVVDGEITGTLDRRVDAVECRLSDSGGDLGTRHGAAVPDDADLRVRLFLGAYRRHGGMLILPLVDLPPFQRYETIILLLSCEPDAGKANNQESEEIEYMVSGVGVKTGT